MNNRFRGQDWAFRQRQPSS